MQGQKRQNLTQGRRVYPMELGEASTRSPGERSWRAWGTIKDLVTKCQQTVCEWGSEHTGGRFQQDLSRVTWDTFILWCVKRLAVGGAGLSRARLTLFSSALWCP